MHFYVFRTFNAAQSPNVIVHGILQTKSEMTLFLIGELSSRGGTDVSTPKRSLVERY